MAKSDILNAPRRRVRYAPSWSQKLYSILEFMKSAARRSTSAIYIKIPADAELRMPWTINAIGLVSL